MEYVDAITKEIDKFAKSESQRKRLRALLNRIIKAIEGENAIYPAEAIKQELDSLTQKADEIAEEIAGKIEE